MILGQFFVGGTKTSQGSIQITGRGGPKFVPGLKFNIILNFYFNFGKDIKKEANF